MKTVTDHLQLSPYTSRIFDMYFGGRSFAVFDIETTGLSPARCKVILSGILLTDSSGSRVVQYFAEQPEDEKQIIEKTLESLSGVDFVLTYNGRHFDMPFMETRAKKYGMTFDPKIYNLDLFLILQGHSALRESLPNLKQKTVEVFMGLSDGRDDKISGAESVALYEQYMHTRAFALEKTILLHNHDDLIQLCKLLPIISKTDFHRAMYKLGFPAGNYLVQKINITGRELHVRGLQTATAQDYISFPTPDMPCSVMMNSKDCCFELTIPCSAKAGALFFDAETLLSGKISPIEKYPSVVNGYLIACEGGKINYMEINKFILQFLTASELFANF